MAVLLDIYMVFWTVLCIFMLIICSSNTSGYQIYFHCADFMASREQNYTAILKEFHIVVNY